MNFFFFHLVVQWLFKPRYTLAATTPCSCKCHSLNTCCVKEKQLPVFRDATCETHFMPLASCTGWDQQAVDCCQSCPPSPCQNGFIGTLWASLSCFQVEALQSCCQEKQSHSFPVPSPDQLYPLWDGEIAVYSGYRILYRSQHRLAWWYFLMLSVKNEPFSSVVVKCLTATDQKFCPDIKQSCCSIRNYCSNGFRVPELLDVVRQAQ